MTKHAKNIKSVDRLTIQHFWKITRQYRTDLLVSWLTIPSALGLYIGVPYVIGKILGNLAHPTADVHVYIYALIALSIITVVTNRVSYSALFRLQPRVMSALHTEVLSALLKRGTSFHNNQISGKLVSDAADYPSAYNQLSSVFFVDILPFVFTLILGIGLVAYSSPLIGLVLLLMTILAIGSGIRFRRRMTPSRKKRHAALKALMSHLADTIVNNQTVKSFGREEEELRTEETLNDILTKARLHDFGELAKDGSHRILGLLLFQITFILLVVHEVAINPGLLATGIFAFSYTMTLSNRLFQVGIMLRTVEEALLLAMPMTEILQQTIEISDKPDAKELVITNGAIDFDSVTFHYLDNTRHDEVFTKLKLHITPGEKVGLVGPSGGGKTTLTKLLIRFENIQAGQIAIDGQNIADVTQTSLRQSIAYVPQEPLLFHRTIAENIAYGKPTASKKLVEGAAKQAHAHEFIMKLPNGYDTIVGERGVKLSGGQRQRVAIARAMLKNAPILVLDEATSALDSESEVAIQAALWELMQDRTAIVVAHRLSTIQRMDRIIVLDGGSIAEEGTHKDLLGQDGLYARLWNHQSGGFLEE